MSENIKVETKQKEKAEIIITEHPKFNGDMKTNIDTSIAMAEKISAMFAPAMPDYYGCKILINDGSNAFIASQMPIGALYVELYFKDRGEGEDKSKKNVVLRGSNTEEGADTLGHRFQALSNANRGRAYEVTKRTYEMLEEFMGTAGRIRWMDYTTETIVPMGVYGKDEVVVKITGLNLNKIITKIYGAKTEEGRYEYIATPSTIIPFKNQEFIIQVSQLDLATVRNLQNALGFNTAQYGQFHRYNG